MQAPPSYLPSNHPGNQIWGQEVEHTPEGGRDNSSSRIDSVSDAGSRVTNTPPPPPSRSLLHKPPLFSKAALPFWLRIICVLSFNLLPLAIEIIFSLKPLTQFSDDYQWRLVKPVQEYHSYDNNVRYREDPAYVYPLVILHDGPSLTYERLMFGEDVQYQEQVLVFKNNEIGTCTSLDPYYTSTTDGEDYYKRLRLTDYGPVNFYVDSFPTLLYVGSAIRWFIHLCIVYWLLRDHPFALGHSRDEETRNIILYTFGVYWLSSLNAIIHSQDIAGCVEFSSPLIAMDMPVYQVTLWIQALAVIGLHVMDLFPVSIKWLFTRDPLARRQPSCSETRFFTHIAIVVAVFVLMIILATALHSGVRGHIPALMLLLYPVFLIMDVIVRRHYRLDREMSGVDIRVPSVFSYWKTNTPPGAPTAPVDVLAMRGTGQALFDPIIEEYLLRRLDETGEEFFVVLTKSGNILLKPPAEKFDDIITIIDASTKHELLFRKKNSHFKSPMDIFLAKTGEILRLVFCCRKASPPRTLPRPSDPNPSTYGNSGGNDGSGGQRRDIEPFGGDRNFTRTNFREQPPNGPQDEGFIRREERNQQSGYEPEDLVEADEGNNELPERMNSYRIQIVENDRNIDENEILSNRDQHEQDSSQIINVETNYILPRQATEVEIDEQAPAVVHITGNSPTSPQPSLPSFSKYAPSQEEPTTAYSMGDTAPSPYFNESVKSPTNLLADLSSTQFNLQDYSPKQDSKGGLSVLHSQRRNVQLCPSPLSRHKQDVLNSNRSINMSTTSENQVCQICLDAPCNAVLFPCFHSGICVDCAVEVVRSAIKCKLASLRLANGARRRDARTQARCPLCRACVRAVLKLREDLDPMTISKMGRISVSMDEECLLDGERGKTEATRERKTQNPESELVVAQTVLCVAEELFEED